MALSIDLGVRVALVTGVSSGIGMGIARMLAQAGADVAGCGFSGVDNANALDFLRDVKTAGKRGLYKQTDVETPDDLESLVKATIKEFGRLDILVSNAGRNVFKGAAACDEAAWQQNLDLNLSSHWRLAKLCRPYLEESGHGVVEIMTSNHAHATIPGCFPYNVAKTALIGLVRSLAVEWGPKVRVVGLAPGFVETPGNSGWFDSFPDPAAERKRTIALHPAGKLGACDDLGAWTAFLASDFAAFATGATYVIDGGRLSLLQDSTTCNKSVQ
jgi:NAD(P)-dependent dehydrogenase (short-subunit alcohol dehydrogenase family)